MKWLHEKLNGSFEPKIKMDVLLELSKYQKTEELFMNHTPVLLDRLSSYKKDDALCAIEELKSCGHVGGSDTIKSQRYITGEGKQLLKEYTQFRLKGILSKVTWWYHNRFKGIWKLLWLIIYPIGTLLGVVQVLRVFRRKL